MGTCSTASRCELCPNRAIYWLAFTQLLQRRSPPRPRDLGPWQRRCFGEARVYARPLLLREYWLYNRGALRTLVDVLVVFETPADEENSGPFRVPRCPKFPRAREL